jgi:hypothetical protein
LFVRNKDIYTRVQFLFLLLKIAVKMNDKFTQSSDIMDHYEWVDVFYTNLYINNVRILVLFYTAMSCMLANVKLTPKKAKMFNFLVEFLIGCLHDGPCLTSVYCASLYIRRMVPEDFICLVEIYSKGLYVHLYWVSSWWSLFDQCLLCFALHKTYGTRRLYISSRGIK